VQPRARVAAAATARRDAGCPPPSSEVETRRSAGPPNNTEDPEGPAQVYIVEIKTIDAIQRPTRTRTQHTDLANMLTAHGHTVTTVPILVGVTGTIYTEHTQALTGLGVTRPGWGLLPETARWQSTMQHHRHTTTAWATQTKTETPTPLIHSWRSGGGEGGGRTTS
jgi:hypothetical protein